MLLPIGEVFLLASGLDILWHFLGGLLVLVSLILIFIILIQDSKGAGLTSAFGAGPGGESLLGARMQRDVARYTAILGTVFALIVIAMGLLGNCRARYGSAGAAGAKAPPAAEEVKKDEPAGAGVPSLEVVPPSTPGSGTEKK